MGAADGSEQVHEPSPGWYRNTGLTPLTVQPDQYPSARLEPGEAAWLPDDPHHANTEPCDAPPPEPTPAPDLADKTETE